MFADKEQGENVVRSRTSLKPETVHEQSAKIRSEAIGRRLGFVHASLCINPCSEGNNLSPDFLRTRRER